MIPKGLIIYYLNRDAFQNMEEEKILELMVRANKSMIKEFESQGYPILFLTTVHEASRIEKIDFKEKT